MLQLIYSKPKLCKAKNGWYVHFRYNGKQKRYKLGLNLIQNEKERQEEFNALAKFLHKKLKNGWNPFDDISFNQDDLRLTDSLDFALEKKRDVISKKSYAGYKGTIKFVKTAIKSLCIDYLIVTSVRRSHIRVIMEKVKEQRSWSNKSYNKNLNYLSAIMDELLHWDIIEVNPVTKIRRLKVKESINVTATNSEHIEIANHLKRYHYNFYVYVMALYSTGIRPKELLSIKIKDIDFLNSEIKLRSTTTKNRKSRVVPINEDLMINLINIGANSSNKELYLFGAFNYNHKHRHLKGLDFCTAPLQIKRDTATKLWHKIVKVGLGINVNLYSMKHKGSDDMLKAGINLDSIRHIFGHSTKRTTKIYAKEITNIYKKDLLQKYPKF